MAEIRGKNCHPTQVVCHSSFVLQSVSYAEVSGEHSCFAVFQFQFQFQQLTIVC